MRTAVLCVLALAACKKGADHGAGGAAKPAVGSASDAECGGAAETLAGFKFDNYTPAETRAPAIAAIKAECAKAHLSSADAKCLAGAKDRLGAIRCPRVLTPELVAIDKAIGTGRCRPVMLTLELAAQDQMATVPEEQREEASAVFKVLKGAFARSCRTDSWSDEAIACFGAADLTPGGNDPAECFKMLPQEVLMKVQSQVRDAVERIQRGEKVEEEPGDVAVAGGGEPIAATGMPACDNYLRARRAFDRCATAPPATKKTLVAVLDPLVKPWKDLPLAALDDSARAQISPLCEQAVGRLVEIGTALGCFPPQ